MYDLLLFFICIIIYMILYCEISNTFDMRYINSDSLNISERRRARCVACLLGRTRGHRRQDTNDNPERPKNKEH